MLNGLFTISDTFFFYINDLYEKIIKSEMLIDEAYDIRSILMVA